MLTDLKKKKEDVLLLVQGNDLEMARSAATGDQSARRLIVEYLYDEVRTVIRYLSCDHRDQDDWVQISLLEILSSIHTFRGESSLKAWANRIATRTAIRLMKRTRSRECTVSLESMAPTTLDAVSDESQRRIAIRRHLSRLLDALSPEQRTAVILRLVYQYSIEDIAEITETLPNTVRARLSRGRKRLKAKIVKDPFLKGWINSRQK
jgi:RNA polymerase sigma-70 factor (ECF subfamily)